MKRKEVEKLLNELKDVPRTSLPDGFVAKATARLCAAPAPVRSERHRWGRIAASFALLASLVSVAAIVATRDETPAPESEPTPAVDLVQEQGSDEKGESMNKTTARTLATLAAASSLVLGAQGDETGTPTDANKPDRWVTYVESTGKQYIDTGITAKPNTKAECKVEWLEFGDVCFLGARKDWNDTRFYMCYCYTQSGQDIIFTGNGKGTNVVWTGGWNCWWEKNRVYNFTVDYSEPDSENNVTTSIEIDGNKVWDKVNPTPALDCGINLTTFAMNHAGTIKAYSKTRCYGLKIWQDGNLVRDYLPCMKGGKAGLYDAVSGTIFYGKGGDLVCDPNSEVPDEYIDYIESEGEAYSQNEQVPAFLDTGVTGRSGTMVAGEFALLSSEDKGLLEARNDTTTYPRYYLLHSYKGKVTCGYGTHRDNSAQCELGKKYYFECELNAGSQKLSRGADGVTNVIYSASEAYTVDTGYSIYLFASDWNGKNYTYAKARTYGFRMWQDGELVRDFKPCLKNGVPGLYDAVSKRIFYSKGTPFGFDNKRAVDRKDVTLVEYIDANGNNTLDTQVPAKSGLRAVGEFAWNQVRTQEQESYRYLENTDQVFYRHKRAFLGAGDFVIATVNIISSI